MRLLFRVLLCLLLAAPAFAREPGGGTRDLRQFAREIGLRDTEGFVETITTLRRDGHLPPRYITKRAASRAGWRPGSDLCRIAPGQAIGGDRFGNRERRLPVAPGRVWYEADLDFDCGRRGAKRLVWSNDGLIFVTADHYETFRAVPE